LRNSTRRPSPGSLLSGRVLSGLSIDHFAEEGPETFETATDRAASVAPLRALSSGPINSIRLSRIDWLWSAKRASVGSRRNCRRVKQEHPLMRIYIIGSDGITLCRKAPATV